MNPPPVVPVVCAVILDGAGRALLAQRPAHKHLGMRWEFPGGKVEPDESSENALHREINEELGCEIMIARALPLFTHPYERVVVQMIPFICRLAPGSPPPHAIEHQAIQWVAIDALPTFDLAPADWPILAWL